MNRNIIVLWTVPVKDVPITGGEIQNKHYYQSLLKKNNILLHYKMHVSFGDTIKYLFQKSKSIIFISDAYFRNNYIIINWLFCLNKKIKSVCFVWRPYETPFNGSPKGWLSNLAFWLYMRPCNTVVVNSKATAQWVNRIVKNKNILICKPSPNVIGHYVERTRKDKVNLLMVGYFVGVKGQLILLDALKYLTKYNWSLELIGGVKDLKYMNDVYNMVKDSNLDGRIEIINNAKQEQIATAYEKADIYIQASLEEGYGMAIAEAMTFGLPIIGNDTGGIPELVEEGVNGYLVKPGCSEDLKNKIAILISDYEQRSKLGNNSFKASQNFNNWQQNTDQFVGEILKLHKTQQ